MNSYNGFTAKERMDVEEQIKKLIALGKVKNPNKCEMCGLETSDLMTHLEDYSKIETLKWLCIYCHMTLHSRYRRPNIWYRLCLNIRAGVKSNHYTTVGQWFMVNRDLKDVQPTGFVPTDKWWELLTLTPIDLNIKKQQKLL